MPFVIVNFFCFLVGYKYEMSRPGHWITLSDWRNRVETTTLLHGPGSSAPLPRSYPQRQLLKGLRVSQHPMRCLMTVFSHSQSNKHNCRELKHYNYLLYNSIVFKPIHCNWIFNNYDNARFIGWLRARSTNVYSLFYLTWCGYHDFFLMCFVWCFVYYIVYFMNLQSYRIKDFNKTVTINKSSVTFLYP